MGLFSKILDKLGFGKEASAAPAPSASAPAGSSGTAVPPPTTPTSPSVASPSVTGSAPAAGAAPAGSGAPAQHAAPISTVDVVAQLEERAASNPQKLNWKTSIVDLLKLLDLDSSLTARKELATELGCPSDLMADSAQMNMWLHKAVLSKLAANGGNVPKELLD